MPPSRNQMNITKLDLMICPEPLRPLEDIKNIIFDIKKPNWSLRSENFIAGYLLADLNQEDTFDLINKVIQKNFVNIKFILYAGNRYVFDLIKKADNLYDINCLNSIKKDNDPKRFGLWKSYKNVKIDNCVEKIAESFNQMEKEFVLGTF